MILLGINAIFVLNQKGHHMHSSLSIKIVITLSVVLLCVGAALFSFGRLHSVGQRYDFDLYTLVPQNAVAVFETDRIVDFYESVEHMHSSKDGNYLSVSELFNCSNDFFNALLLEAPHALSKQMNKVLVSFHEPDTPLNQVLYATLESGGRKAIEKYLDQYSTISFPVKRINYLSEEIKIYPLKDGRFLALWLTNDFLVISFQKKLLQEAIDAYDGRGRLLQDSSFGALHKEKQRNVSAMLYLRTQSVPLGQRTDSLRGVTKWGNWMELRLEMDNEAIYATGVCHETDTSVSKHPLYLQKPFSGWAANILPASTSSYTIRSASEHEATSIPMFSSSFSMSMPDYATCCDSALTNLLNECGVKNIVSCTFSPDERAAQSACAISIVFLSDERRARTLFFQWLQSVSHYKKVMPAPRFEPMYERYPHSLPYRKYLLPPSTLFFQLTGCEGVSFYTYACFYHGALLLAADAQSLSAYIEAMECGDTLEESIYYNTLINTLALSGQYLLMADMNALSQLPLAYVRQLPTFFLKHIDFFRHFLLAMQFTHQDGFLIPYITLLYRPTSEFS